MEFTTRLEYRLQVENSIQEMEIGKAVEGKFRNTGH